MADVHHQASSAIVDRYGAQILFVMEDLTGVQGLRRACGSTAWTVNNAMIGRTMIGLAR